MSLLLELFFAFAQIGLFSVGGGYAAIPLIQNQAVDLHAWLTPEEFLDLATLAEMTPGPIAVNAATFVGIRTAGLPGALVATFGCIFPSLILVSLLSFLYRRYRQLSVMRGILGALRPVVVALILTAGLNMLLQIAFGGRGHLSPEHFRLSCALLFAGAFFALRRFRPSPILVMALCGVLGLLLGLAGLM